MSIRQRIVFKSMIMLHDILPRYLKKKLSRIKYTIRTQCGTNYLKTPKYKLEFARKRIFF